MKNKKLLPVWLLVIIDIVLIGVTLVVFALFHHVLPQESKPEGKVNTRPTGAVINQSVTASSEERGASRLLVNTVSALSATQDECAEKTAPAPAVNNDIYLGAPSSKGASAYRFKATKLSSGGTEDSEATDEAEEEKDVLGNFSHKFADKFIDSDKPRTTGKANSATRTYVSRNLNVTMTISRIDCTGNTGVWKSTAYVTDFYIRDISQLQSILARDMYGKGYAESVYSIAKRTGAIAAINGDYYGARENGVVIRNGVIYRRHSYPYDICVLYWDGRMETFAEGEWTKEMLEDGVYQAWCFGPSLLDDEGNAITEFDSWKELLYLHPRTAIGYFEPGHYCFVNIDGRSNSSVGITMKELAEFMQSLGCKRAYNLDGGNSSTLNFMGDTLTDGDSRAVPDALIIVDYIQ